MQHDLNDWQAEGMLDMIRQVRENRVRGSFSPTFYKEQTGRQGITLEEFFRENRQEFVEEAQFRQSKQDTGIASIQTHRETSPLKQDQVHSGLPSTSTAPLAETTTAPIPKRTASNGTPIMATSTGKPSPIR